jgi:hypothetical protein
MWVCGSVVSVAVRGICFSTVCGVCVGQVGGLSGTADKLHDVSNVRHDACLHGLHGYSQDTQECIDAVIHACNAWVLPCCGCFQVFQECMGAASMNRSPAWVLPGLHGCCQVCTMLPGMQGLSSRVLHFQAGKGTLIQVHLKPAP